LIDGISEGDQLCEWETHEGALHGLYRVHQLLPSLPGSAAMRFHPDAFSFQCFHAGGGQVDQGFQEIRNGTRPAASKPQAFPGDMAFPLIAGVKQIDAVKIRLAVVPAVWVHSIGQTRFLAEAMARRV
jgi:hypothetical protein